MAARGLGRVQIANTLGDRRDAGAVTVLAVLVSNEGRHSTAAAEAAIMALGKIATPEACEKLAQLRKEKDFPYALAPVLASLNAAGVLSAPVNGKAPSKANLKAAMEIYRELAGPSHWPMYVSRAAFAALLRLDPAGAEKRILDTFQNDKSALKFYYANLKPVAIAGIRSVKSWGASAKFAAEMPNLQPSEQLLLLEALGARGDSGARKALLAVLKTNDAALRNAAISALGQLGDASLVSPIVKALAPRTPETSADIFKGAMLEQTLVRMSGGKKVDQAIAAELKNCPESQKSVLISVLAKRDAKSAMPALLKETVNPAVAGEAFRALAVLAGAEDGPMLLDTLVRLQDPKAAEAAQEAAAQALSKMPAPAASALVRKALAQGKAQETRSALVRLLSSCPDDGALSELKSAASDPALRESAFQALEYWPDLGAWDMLAASYTKPESEGQRVRALRALVRLAGEANSHVDAKLTDRYKELLAGAKNDNDRKLILSALSGAAHPQALELAKSLVANDAVRAEAEIAVQKITEALKKK
jgi:HEAT repeat protein